MEKNNYQNILENLSEEQKDNLIRKGIQSYGDNYIIGLRIISNPQIFKEFKKENSNFLELHDNEMGKLKKLGIYQEIQDEEFHKALVGKKLNINALEKSFGII